MKISKWKAVFAAMLLSICMIKICDVAYAASEDYTTITVEATDDESGVYMYAIDSTEDSAWQTSNTFYVLPNTLHTVYVKDAAGNITSSEVMAEAAVNVDYENTYDLAETENTSETSSIAEVDPYEAGVGTGTGTVTDYVNDDSKEYYTITTKNGNNFYMIIDHRNSDSNVYFTKPVSELDLLSLAAEAGEVEEASLEQKAEEEVIMEPVEEKDSDSSSGSSVMEYLPMIVVVGVLCAGYYYFMIYKKKKAIKDEYDEDAADMDQFIPVEDDEDAALFAYKGNKASTEDEENMDAILDEFYENNADIDDINEEPEEDYDTGIMDTDFDEGEPILEDAEDLYDVEENSDPDLYDDNDREEDDI